jgi:hypothetical protein
MYFNFIKKVFSPTILLISLSLLTYTFYKSEIYWEGSKREYYYVYYIISLILIFFSFLTFFLNQLFKEYLIIIFLSFTIGVYFFEGYLISKNNFSKKNLFKDNDLKEKLYEKKTGKKWDKRSKFEIYENLKKKDNQITLAVAPRKYVVKNKLIFSFSGISNSKTIYCNENGYYSLYHSDRYGFNNPDEEWDKEEIEYLLIGDSFSHGACVNRPYDIASNLRKLSNKSVLNLGQGGNAPLIEYATLREYLKPNVRKVLWMYFEGNDLNDLQKELEDEILANYLKNPNFSQNLKLKQNEINILKLDFLESQRKIEIEKATLNFKLKKFVKIYNTRLLISQKFKPKPTGDSFSAFKKILKLSKEQLENNNSKLYFVYLPEYDRYTKKYNNREYNLIKNLVNELEIPFIDIPNEVFKNKDQGLKLFPFGMWGHYNIEGYRKVSETIYAFTQN